MSERVTSLKLIEVAVDMFGRHGFEPVSTYAIAQAAGAQQSAVSYHFGSKEKLYLACAEHIAVNIGRRLAPLLQTVSRARTIEGAGKAVETLLCGLLDLMLDDTNAAAARFVVREQMTPTSAYPILWEKGVKPVVDALLECLSLVARGKVEAEALGLLAFTMMGQVFAFRSARGSLGQITGWRSIGAAEVELAKATVLANARAILDSLVKRRNS